ncbi:FtsB family cell division protein [Niallia nealsonii]|uniref:Cell division protein DIVIC n=1 Tax=Niallia nealsonii TaxID=115979 RepID=A0A2N0YZ15_9BACI|nr:septum formation initiator family protein [Niallia nealsonii]PKG22485.1 cell division protein DIVIC [Niallia nealsonii]
MSAIKKPDVANLQTEYNIKQEANSLSAARRKKLLFRRLTLFFLFAFVMGFIMISTLISQSSTLDEKIAEKKKLQVKVASLQEKEKELNDQIVKLQDEDYLAKLARKDLFLSEKGEIIFNIPEEKEEKK